MKTASTILGIIGGLLGIVTGYLTQTVGGINSFFEIDNADTTIVIGKIIIAFSVIILVLSCFIFKRPKLFGMIILSFGIVYILMSNYISGSLMLVSGILGILSQQQKASQSPNEANRTNWTFLKKISYKRIFIALGILLLVGAVIFGICKVVQHYKIINAKEKSKEGLALIEKEEYRKAIPYLFDAANYGNVSAQIGLGKCYSNLFKMDSCLIWWRRAAPQSDEATYYLTAIYEFVIESGGFSEYNDEAWAHLSRIAKDNSNTNTQSIAQVGLAKSYQYGRGVKLDYKKALYWYQKAAQNGRDEIFKLNQDVPVGHFSYKASDFRYRESVGSSFYRETADGLYLIVDVLIKNIDRESKYAVAQSCFLTDEDGYKYEPNSDASIALSMQGYNTFSLSTINPGITSKGILVFEVPRKDDYYLFVPGGFGSNKYKPILLKK